MKLPLERSFWPVLAGLVALLAVFELTRLDLAVQDCWFDFTTGRWWVDGAAPVPRLLFYSGPKALLIGFGLGVLVLVFGPSRWRDRLGVPRQGGRRDLFVVIATLASGPALIGLGKATTHVFCPSEIRRYGGDVAYVTWCGSFPPGERPARRGRCFPAGHASGGFALLSLAGLARTRRGQMKGLAIGMAAGWAMGLYQMFKGAHYLSHTVVTMALVWLVFLAWRRVAWRFASQGTAAQRDLS